jgi:hypothetical protein
MHQRSRHPPFQFNNRLIKPRRHISDKRSPPTVLGDFPATVHLHDKLVTVPRDSCSVGAPELDELRTGELHADKMSGAFGDRYEGWPAKVDGPGTTERLLGEGDEITCFLEEAGPFSRHHGKYRIAVLPERGPRNPMICSKTLVYKSKHPTVRPRLLQLTKSHNHITIGSLTFLSAHRSQYRRTQDGHPRRPLKTGMR